MNHAEYQRIWRANNLDKVAEHNRRNNERRKRNRVLITEQKRARTFGDRRCKECNILLRSYFANRPNNTGNRTYCYDCRNDPRVARKRSRERCRRYYYRKKYEKNEIKKKDPIAR